MATASGSLRRERRQRVRADAAGLQDRLYLNDGHGHLRGFPGLAPLESGSCVVPGTGTVTATSICSSAAGGRAALRPSLPRQHLSPTTIRSTASCRIVTLESHAGPRGAAGASRRTCRKMTACRRVFRDSSGSEPMTRDTRRPITSRWRHVPVPRHDARAAFGEARRARESRGGAHGRRSSRGVRSAARPPRTRCRRTT